MYGNHGLLVDDKTERIRLTALIAESKETIQQLENKLDEIKPDGTVSYKALKIIRTATRSNQSLISEAHDER